MKRLKPIIKVLGLGFPAAFLMVLGGIYLYLPHLVAEVRNPLAAYYNSGLEKKEKPSFSSFGIRNAYTFRLWVNDSIQLEAYTVPSVGQVRGTIVALHGYRSNKNRFLPAARYFSLHGWNFIALDLRAHNGSSGRYTGFSYFERHDTNAFLDSLESHGLIRRPLVLYGHSIGAATAVFTAARRDDVDILVLESCFADFSDLIPNYLAYYLGSEMMLPDALSRDLFERLNIPLDSLNPLDVAEFIHIPVLQVQGEADTKVKPGQARALYDRWASPQKQWILVPGGTHNHLWLPDTATYFNRINAFLTRVHPIHPAQAAIPQ